MTATLMSGGDDLGGSLPRWRTPQDPRPGGFCRERVAYTPHHVRILDLYERPANQRTTTMNTTLRRKHSPAMARVTSLALILLPLITFGVLLWLLHDATQTLNTAWEQKQ